MNACVPRRSDEGTTRGERKARLQDDARALEAEGAHERGEKHGRGLSRGPGALERVAEDGATRKAEHGLDDARKNDARHGRNVERTKDKGQRGQRTNEKAKKSQYGVSVPGPCWACPFLVLS